MKAIKKFLLGSCLFLCVPILATEQELDMIAPREMRPIWNISHNFRHLINDLTSPVRIGVQVTSLSGHVMFEQYQDQQFVPFSNTMLITAGAALYYLGRDFTFHTQVVTDGVINGNTVEGNLYLKGGGDPTLSGYDVIAFIGQLAAMGITTITGGFYCDYYIYDEMPYVSGCSLSDTVEYWTSPVFGLVVDRNFVDRSLPGRTVFNLTLTCDPVSLLVQSITISSMQSVFSAYVLGICAAFGITIQGTTELGHVPDGATVLVDHTSTPLISIITEMLAHSYAVYGDSILKMIGIHCFGLPGTWDKGTQAVSNFLQEIGISSHMYLLEDGSGISRNNSISPANMVKFLSWMHRSDFSTDFMNSLPTSGINKNLKGLIQEPRKKGLTRSDIIYGVSTLSGFVYTKNKPSEIFSIMFDGLVPPYDPDVPTPNVEELTEALTTCLTT